MTDRPSRGSHGTHAGDLLSYEFRPPGATLPDTKSRRALVALLIGAVGVMASSCSGVPSESPGAPTSTTVATDHAWTADDYASAVPQEMPMVETSSRPAPTVVTVGVVASSLVGVATAAWFLRQRRRS